MNDEKVLGNIPMVTVAGNYYKVSVTSKKLVFDWTGGTGPIETMSLHPKLAFNELSYADIAKVEIKRYWRLPSYLLIIWVLKKGLLKKMKQKKLFEGDLSPSFNYLKEKKSLGLNEKEAKREYAIEVENLLNSVLMNKVVKTVGIGPQFIISGLMSIFFSIMLLGSRVWIPGYILFTFGAILIILGIFGSKMVAFKK